MELDLDICSCFDYKVVNHQSNPAHLASDKPVLEAGQTRNNMM